MAMTCCDHHRINCRQGRDCPNRVSLSGAGVLIFIATLCLSVWAGMDWLFWRML